MTEAASFLSDLPAMPRARRTLEGLPEASSRKRFLAEERAVEAVVSPDGVIRSVDPSVRALLGYGPEQLVGAPLFRLIPMSDLYPVFRGIAEMLTQGRPEAVWTFRMRSATGECPWLEAKAVNRLPDVGVRGIELQLRRVESSN